MALKPLLVVLGFAFACVAVPTHPKQVNCLAAAIALLLASMVF